MYEGGTAEIMSSVIFGEVFAAVVNLYIDFKMDKFREQQSNRKLQKITTTASRMRERMIHQIFMLVISSQHLETEGRRERFMRTSQKYLTAAAQSVVLWQSFAVPFPLVNSRAPALW